MELLEIGHVSKPHGLKGEVMVVLNTNRTERMQVGTVLHAGERCLTVKTSRGADSHWTVHFEGIETREVAESLRGVVLEAEPIDDPDELWVHELVGAEVQMRDGSSRGTVVAVLANPASDLLQLDTGHLVPLVFVVANSDGVIVIDPPEGLFDL